jgi:hypothetical protein
MDRHILSGYRLNPERVARQLGELLRAEDVR